MDGPQIARDAGEAREGYWEEVALEMSPGRKTAMNQNKTVHKQALEVVGSEWFLGLQNG